MVEVGFKLFFDFFFDLRGGSLVGFHRHVFQRVVHPLDVLVAQVGQRLAIDFGHQGDEAHKVGREAVLHVEEGLPQVVYLAGGVVGLAGLDELADAGEVGVQGGQV